MNCTAVIIDDEPNNVDNLSFLLQKNCPQVTVKATANNADEGIRIILEHQPEIVFLDIQMPGKDGFEMLKTLDRYSFEVIFVTAFDNYGIQAVKFSAIDYLLKPVVASQLMLAVDRASRASAEKKHNLQLEYLVEFISQQQKKEDKRLALPTMKELHFVPIREIIRCEASASYTYFFIEGGRKLVVVKPILDYEELLAGFGFIRCHRSHLVNRNFVEKWRKDEGGYLLMKDGSRVPVARGKKDGLRKQLDSIN